VATNHTAALKVRGASQADLFPLVAIDAYAQSHADRVDFLRRSIEQNECFVAHIDDRIAGFAILNYSFFSFGFIPLLVVSFEHRRQGIALQLLATLEAECASPKLFTSANASNGAAHALLEHAGFVGSGAIVNLNQHDEEIIFFKSC
jgi:GNAT superfamily N-acetyltransferase